MSNNTIQYSSEKLKKFEIILDEALRLTKEELENLKNDRKAQKQHLAQTNVDFNQSSKHFQQQAKDKQLINRLQRKSRELQSALKRIQDKTYGVCERTGQLIREDRLIAKPTARFDILNT